MREETREIEGASDFETGKARVSPLAYTVAWPDAPAKGLLIFIPGFGGDSDPAYSVSLRRHVVEAHGYAAVSADYHCLHARPENGGRLGVEPRDHVWLYGLATLKGLPVGDPQDFTALCNAFA